jgi:hypothetical protein
VVLYGKTDRTTIAASPPKVDVRVFVGSKKKQGRNGSLIFGDDLVTHFRVETDNKAIARALSTIVDKNNLVEELEIILAYTSVEKAFDCKAQRWSRKGDELSGLLWECDRAKIYQKKEVYKTPYGDVRNRFVECNEPCPVSGTQEKCSLGCANTGILYFYLPALLDRGHNALCSLVLSGEFNIRELTQKLYDIESQFGTIKNVTASPSTYNAVLYRLGRYTSDRPHPVIHNGKRTGKTTLKPTHLVSLQIDPNWLTYYQNMQQIMQVQALGYRPNLKLIEQVYGQIAVETPVLPKQTLENTKNLLPITSYLLPEWEMTRQLVEELQSLWRSHNWTQTALEELLISYFDISDRRQLMSIDQEQFKQLKLCLASEEIKKEFLT